MTFLSHSIPWDTLCSELEYRVPRSGPGPQHAIIAFIDHPNTIRQLEYFAQHFGGTIQEHAREERRKHRSLEDYTARAKNWKTVVVEPLNPSSPSITHHSRSSLNVLLDENAERLQRNRALRELRDALDSTGWTTSTKSCGVYPSSFIDKYFHAYNVSQYRRHTHMYFLERGVGQKLQDWLDWSNFYNADVEHVSHDERQKTEFELNDVLKLLVIESVCAEKLETQLHTTEVMFLLIHRPQLQLERFIGLGMGCCPIWCGFENIAVYALRLFLLLNVIVALQDVGISEITMPMGKVVVFEKKQAREVSSIFQWLPERAPRYDELLPRPTYMNLKLWRDLVQMLCRDHENQAETIFFSMILFPLAEEDNNGHRQPVEVDLLSDCALLKSRLKMLWRIMIVIEMTAREIGKPLNWEYVIMESLGEMFGRPLDPKSWYSYEIERQTRQDKHGNSDIDRSRFDRFECL